MDGAIRHACILAKARAQHPFAFHAVVVMKGGATISKGFNWGERHAEKNALGKLWPSKRRGCTIYSIRVTKGGKLSSAKPCPVCHEYLKENGIKTVYYSDSDGSIQRMRM